MLLSKMMPTNSPALLITGLPELPPMMSTVETKLNGVSPAICSRASCQLFGRIHGSLASWTFSCSNAPPMMVQGGNLLPPSS